MRINSNELNREQNENFSKYLHTISDFERIGDHSNNLCAVAEEIQDKKIQFTEDAVKEMYRLSEAVREILGLAINAFIQDDEEIAFRVEPLESCIDGLCDQMKANHVARLQAGKCSLAQGFVFNDFITNCERVADHCSNIAIAVIELNHDVFDAHDYVNSIQKVHGTAFERYLKEYSDRYGF